MKKLAILTIVIALAYTSHAQNVTIPDANFKAALIEKGVDSNADGEIAYSEASAIISLDVGGSDISDMTGIEAFTNLDSLYCSGNLITSLDLRANTKLKVLGCFCSSLLNLDVSQNELLTHLWFGGIYGMGTEISSLDLSNCPNLQYLNCKNSPLNSLDLSNNPVLEYLNCAGCGLAELNLSNNTELIELECGSNQLTKLVLTDNTNTALTQLWCGDNQLTSLDVSQNNALKRLECSGNLLTCLDIRNNTEIKYLDVSGMQTLEYVCVWTNPSFHASVEVYRRDTPHVYFSTDSMDCKSCQISTAISVKEYPLASIYPNPATDQLTIEFDQTAAATSVILFDVTGKLVYSEMIAITESQTHTLNLSSLRKGLYFIRISNDRFSVTEKMIISTHPQPPLYLAPQ